MKSYDEIAESIIKKYNSRREQKRRKAAVFRRTAALTLGTAAVLGIGIFAQTLKPPKPPTSDSGSIITETSPSPPAPAVTSAKPASVTTTAVTSAQKATATTASAATSTSSERTAATSSATRTAARTTASAAATTAQQTTAAPTSTTPAVSTASLEERIASIYMRLPEMAPILQQYPAIAENGEKIPTCAMMFSDSNYLAIINYENGINTSQLDINGDGRVDFCDLLEVTAYSQTYVSGYPSEKYKQANYNAMRKAIPDDTTYYNLSHMELREEYRKRVFTEYMIFKGLDIPDSDELESQLREYAGERPIPDNAFTDAVSSVSNAKTLYDKLYDYLYNDLNKEHTYSDYQLEMFGKIDSGEYFPDANRDGVIDYMDIYRMLLYIRNEADYQRDKDWLKENCIYSPNENLMMTKNYLVLYLFYYKGQDYVSNIEMQLEYEKEQERLSAPSIVPTEYE